MGKHYKKREKKIAKFKIGKIIYILVLIFFALLVVISSINIVKWYLNNKENSRIQQEISESVTINKDEENIETKYVIDFQELKTKNPDTVGWIKVNGTDIEYTVVKAKNNDYYLTHNFEKKYNKSGWIFADYKNKIDGTDKNIVIYGHNVRDNSMFASLKNILKEEWYNNPENYKITFITEQETAIYEVFSVYQIEREDYYIQTDFASNTEFAKFINKIKSRSIKDFNIEVTNEDNILTLSTCANNNNYRIVLHSKKIK